MKSDLQKTLYINKYKTGISLIVLIITIVVALILATTVIFSTTGAIDNARITTFFKDLSEVQDATENYYINNNVMPISDDSTVIDKNGLIGISTFQNIILEEIIENNDLDSQFYVINLEKLNITKSKYGTKKLGESDIFVISYPTMNVYYPYGVDAKGTTFFSITSKMSSIIKIDQEKIDTSLTSVISSDGIKVTKNNSWSNKMGVNIDVQMAPGELLYMSVSGGTDRLITTTTGANIFEFNLLSSIIDDNETIKVPTLTIEEANYIEQGTKPLTERYVHILKYKDSVITGKVKIDLSNFSLNQVVIIDSTTSSYSTLNTLKLFFSDSESGIKEIKYEYLSKYSDDGTTASYYQNFSNFDNTYMKNKAKKAVIKDDLTTTISAPKNVQSIKVAVIDKAGNISLYDKEIAPRLYIAYSIDSSTTQLMQLTAKVFSGNGIKSIKFSKSIDGVNFTDEQVYTLNTTINGLTVKQCLPYINIPVNIAYIKVVAENYDSTIIEERIVNIKIKNNINYEVGITNKPLLSTGMTALKWDGAQWITITSPDVDTSWYNYTNKEWANAKTEDGSMWVWIPRYIYKISSLWHSSSTLGGTINVQFSQGINDNWNSKVVGELNTNTDASASNNTWTNHPGFKFGNTELTGIWVAKFTASGTTSALNILPGVTALRSTTISNAFSACRNMETNSRYGWNTSGTGIDTHLMKNVEWGAVSYLSKSCYGKDNTEVSTNTSSTVTGGGTLLLYVTYTGLSTTGNVHGIYDMPGNTYEYTAAYINSTTANLTNNGANLKNAPNEYKDVYTITTDSQVNNYNNAANKKGDAIYETSSSHTGSNSWFSDFSTMPNGTSPFFAMGGLSSSAASAGCFSFYMYTGASSNSYVFRPTLLVNAEL